MTEVQKRRPRSYKLFRILLLASCIIVIAAVGTFFWQRQHPSAKPVAKKDTAEQTSIRILHKVGTIYALPKDDEPSIAAIQDTSKLANQQFFDRARNGDYLLVYPKAKLALIFREQSGQLINVGPISAEEQ